MSFAQFVTLCAIISGLISLIDFFVSKEKLEDIDNKLKAYLPSGVEKLTNLFERVVQKIEDFYDWFSESPDNQSATGCLFVIILLLIVGVHRLGIIPDSVMELIFNSLPGFVWGILFLLSPIAIIIILGIVLALISGIVHLMVLSKGVIGFISFILFLITTGYQLFEWFNQKAQ